MADTQKKLNPTKEYISNGAYYALRTTTLSNCIDDISSEVYNIYGKMLNDPKIAKCIYILKIRVLGNGLEIFPCFSESHPEYDDAAAIANFCTLLIKELEKPLRYTLEQLLDGLVFGHKIAEVTWSQVVNNKTTYFLPTKIKVKRTGAVNFVVDSFSNVVGFSYQQSSDTTSTTSGKLEKKETGYKIVTQNKQELDFLEKDKFIYFTFKPKDEDPRGQSILRSAYNSWKFKQEVHPEYMRYLMMCAIPLLVGITPVDEDTINILKDADGNIILNDSGAAETMTSVEALMQALATARNASAIAVKGGTDVKEIGAGAANGGGAPFYNALEYYNNEIEDSILLQTLATSQGVYQSRASSQIHMSTLDDFAFNIKAQLIDMLVATVFRQAITYNFGEEYLKYMPVFTLGDTERRDFAQDATAVAALHKVNWFTNDQMIQVDGLLGLPPRQNNIDDAAMTVSEILKLNKDLLDQENVNYEIESNKAELNLKKVKQLVELKTLLTSSTTSIDKDGKTKVSNTAQELDSQTIKEIDDTIKLILEDLNKPIESNTLGKLKELQEVLKEKESNKSKIKIDSNYYPNKSRTINFSEKLKNLLSLGGIDL